MLFGYTVSITKKTLLNFSNICIHLAVLAI